MTFIVAQLPGNEQLCQRGFRLSFEGRPSKIELRPSVVSWMFLYMEPQNMGFGGSQSLMPLGEDNSPCGWDVWITSGPRFWSKCEREASGKLPYVTFLPLQSRIRLLDFEKRRGKLLGSMEITWLRHPRGSRKQVSAWRGSQNQVHREVTVRAFWVGVENQTGSPPLVN